MEIENEAYPILHRRTFAPERLEHGIRPLGPEGARALDTRHLRCLSGDGALQRDDPVLAEIAREMEATSVLETMRRWAQQLDGSSDNNHPVFRKLMHLFDAGVTPERMEGHHDGIAFGLRTGDLPGAIASRGNLMNLAWSATVGREAPWVGKSFAPLEPGELGRFTGGAADGEGPTYLGINHFHRLPHSRMNRLFYALLTLWMGLRRTPLTERGLYGHDRDGGLFIARRARSVWSGTQREVFQLNYRWPALGGRPPFSWLIDEMVELSDGLYLGQLLFATRRLLEPFDPRVQPEQYRYQHFGHFILADDRWGGEMRRVFGRSVGAGAITTPLPAPHADKFTRLRLADFPDAPTDDRLFDEIQEELRTRENILDLFRSYSRDLHRSLDNDSRHFQKLGELFRRGTGPRELHGFLRGALISFRADGMYRFGRTNTLNAAWRLGRTLSPWTGKTFEPISPERLYEITEGEERGEVPTFWGTNTLVFRNPGERLIQSAMHLADIWMEPAPPEEAARYGYDARSFFFIARQGRSILPENGKKSVFQFNYRWPRLRTFPPDHWCIDELVEIAQGLYLGQLTYATVLKRRYDPALDPAAYRYRVFGYFLLMDEEWHRLRLEMGFDPYNV